MNFALVPVNRQVLYMSLLFRRVELHIEPSREYYERRNPRRFKEDEDEEEIIMILIILRTCRVETEEQEREMRERECVNRVV